MHVSMHLAKGGEERERGRGSFDSAERNGAYRTEN